MKSVLHIALLVGGAWSLGTYGALANQPAPNADSQVKISKMQARQIALDRSPEGTVKSEKLEQNGERRVWVIDIARYREPRHVTTVMVDADTGAVQSGTPHTAKK